MNSILLLPGKSLDNFLFKLFMSLDIWISFFFNLQNFFLDLCFSFGPSILIRMSHCLFLSVLCWCVLSKWEQSGCKALTLNSVILHQISGGGAGVYQRRRRRSWVWNQFFVLEEYTGDEPLYIGKVQEITQGRDFWCVQREHVMSLYCTNLRWLEHYIYLF